MANASFSLSISSRGNDYVIGGAGSLDIDGIASLRQTVEESCKKEGASILLDLMLVSELDAEVIVRLAEVADFCRGLGVPFSVNFNPEVAQSLTDAGYDAELMPIRTGP